MKINIKRLHPDAVIPKYAKAGDAGMDLTAVSSSQFGRVRTYKTGIALEIPEGYVGLLFPRSSVFKTSMIMSNCVGVIDSGYRGEVMLKYITSPASKPYESGDRVGQLIVMPYPAVEFQEVETLTTSERGEGGYGSTGK